MDGKGHLAPRLGSVGMTLRGLGSLHHLTPYKCPWAASAAGFYTSEVQQTKFMLTASSRQSDGTLNKARLPESIRRATADSHRVEFTNRRPVQPAICAQRTAGLQDEAQKTIMPTK